MKLILSRGLAPTQIAAQDLTITSWNAPKLERQAGVLYFHLGLDGQPRIEAYDSSFALSLQFKAFDQLWQTVLPDGTRVWFGALPWGVLPDLNELCRDAGGRDLYLPWRSWREGLWYDGPLIWVESGQVQAISLPGAPSMLVIGTAFHDSSGAGDWYKVRAVRAWKISLAWAMRERLQLDPTQHYRLQLDEETGSSILGLIALRLAFPKIRFCWLDRPQTFGPQWKRLAQNLNIDIWLAPTQIRDCLNLPVDGLCRLWAKPLVRNFLHELQREVPLIPGRLLELIEQRQII